MTQLKVLFEKVTASAEQINVLFDMLNERLHRISHENTIYNEHKNFVRSHPYRIWFLVKFQNNYVGSFYITQENTIGINVSERCARLVVAPIIEFVASSYQPLAAIPSVRSGKFSINIPPSNKVLAESLEDIGAKLAQLTYYLPD